MWSYIKLDLKYFLKIITAMITKLFCRKGIRLLTFIGVVLLLFMKQTALISTRNVYDITNDIVKDETFQSIVKKRNDTLEKQFHIPKSSKPLNYITDVVNTSEETQQSLKTKPNRTFRPSTDSFVDDTFKDMVGVYCSDKSTWNEELSVRLGRLTSDMKNWDFDQTVECPNINISKVVFQKSRPKLSLDCRERNISQVQVKKADDNSDIHVAPFGDGCLDRYIQECCKGKFRVPNVVHYVWYMRRELTFVGFTSMLSVIRFVNPCFIIFHGDKLPYGTYWNFLVNISPNIIHLKRERPEYVAGQQIKHREHSSDVMRIEALLHYGGIYLDTDTVIVRSIEPLRDYSCVMSNQSSGLMGSAFVMAEKNAKFLQLWMNGYRFHYNGSKYTYNAMIYPKQVADNHKDLIHIEYGTISRPINMIGGKIYYPEYATYNWSYIYGVHLYSRIFKKPFNENTIKKMNSTVGSISRHVIFGNKELCTD